MFDNRMVDCGSCGDCQLESDEQREKREAKKEKERQQLRELQLRLRKRRQELVGDKGEWWHSGRVIQGRAG